MSFLSQFFSGGKNEELGAYGVGLATGFSSQIPVDLMLIGGGGGGGSVKNTPYGPTYTNLINAMLDSYQGGGGGAGRVLVYTNCIVNTGVAYPITVGAGGAANQRGGTSKFGILRSGGGGRGGGTNPDGTPFTPEVRDNWGGSEGGHGMAYAVSPAPTPATGPVFPIRPLRLDNQGYDGKLNFTDQITSISVYNSPGPLFSPLGNNYLVNANNIFKQAVNSRVFEAPVNDGNYNYSGYAPGAPNFGTYGQGGVGGCYPHNQKLPLNAPRQALNSVYRDSIRTSELGITPPSSVVGTKDFMIDFFNRASIPSILSDGQGGIGGGGINFGTVPNTPTGSRYVFRAVSPYDYLGNTFFSPNPAVNTPRNFDYSRTAPVTNEDYRNVTIPVFLTNPLVGSIYTQQIPIGGGGISISAPAPFPSFPQAPIPDLTTKLLTWTDTPGFDAAIPGGSPGNGGGGSGGNRFGPTILQGTVTVSRSTPSFGGSAPTVSVPYATNILASPLSYASGGSGGSGSVWIIYPTDYSAATVVGNTPVPSPPAFRIYRWDGAGSITFNAS